MRFGVWLLREHVLRCDEVVLVLFFNRMGLCTYSARSARPPIKSRFALIVDSR